MKKFKLLKDLPLAKAGTIVTFEDTPVQSSIKLIFEVNKTEHPLCAIYEKELNEWLEEIITKDIEKRYDLVFYIPIEFPLEDDGVRFKDKEFQKKIDEKIREVLDDYDVPYITLTGSVEERLKKFYDIVNLFENNNF